MANKIWRGDAIAVAQVDTLTVGGTIEVGDKFIVTINGRAVSVSATTTSATTTATEIYNALTTSPVTSYPEFAEITWTNPSAGVVRATAVTAGKPFTLTATTTESDDSAADAQTFTRAATTANAGPKVWGTASNWVGGVAPVSTDDVYIENFSGDILYDLDQNTIDLTSLNIAASFTGKLGLPEINSDNSTSYSEYRPKSLKIGATTVNVGYGPGNGSSRIRLDGDSTNSTVNVENTGSPESGFNEALFWKGSGTNTVNISKGALAIAGFAGETAAVATLRVGFKTNVTGDARVRGGSGLTLTTLNQSGGVVELNAAATTINKIDGELTTNTASTITTLTNDSGPYIHNGAGTITTLTLGGGAKLDCSRNERAFTITNTVQLYEGAEIFDPNGRCTMSGGYKANRCSALDIRVTVGTNKTYTVS